MGDLDADTNHDGGIKQSDDDDEEVIPGRIVGVNDDDDNLNGLKDLADGGSIANENNLVRTELRVHPLSGRGVGMTVRLEVSQGAGNIKVWETSQKGTHITLPKTYTVGTDSIPDAVFIEGISPGDTVLDLVVSKPGGGELVRDKVAYRIVDFRLESVEFENDHAIFQDSGVQYTGLDYLDANGDDDGEDSGDRRFPVAYRRDTNIKIDNAMVKFDAAIDTQHTSVLVRPAARALPGSGSADTYPFNDVTVDLAGRTEILVRDAESSAPLKDAVLHYPNFYVEWEFSFDQGTSWVPAGQSDNRLYATLENPAPLRSWPVTSKYYETLFDIGTRNAHGKSKVDDVVAGIWSDFKSPIPGIRRKPIDGFNVTDNQEIHYWLGGAAPGSCQTLPGLLVDPLGRSACGSISMLMIESLNSVGIGGSNVVEIRADTAVNPGATRFMVKNWNLGEHIRTGPDGINDTTPAGDDAVIIPLGQGTPNKVTIDAGADGTLDTVTAGGDDVIVGTTITTGPNGISETMAHANDDQPIPVGQGAADSIAIGPGPDGVLNSAKAGDDTSKLGITVLAGRPAFLVDFDARDQDGVPGQGNTRPPRAFVNHFVVQLSGKIYDPSYGIGPFATEQAHEDAASEGILYDSATSTLATKNQPGIQELKYTVK
jgi:hypothetical protein